MRKKYSDVVQNGEKANVFSHASPCSLYSGAFAWCPTFLICAIKIWRYQWGHIDVTGLCCYLRPRWCLGPCCCWGPYLGLRSYCIWGLCWCPWPMSLKSMMVSVVCVAEQNHVDILSLCNCQVLWWCPWPVQWQRAMLMSMVCAATSDHAEVHGTCWHWRPYGCLWSVLSPGIMCKSMIHAPTDYKGWGNYMVLLTTDSLLRKGT